MVKNATLISRDPVYDIMKGIMIILVVIGHNRFANTELKDIIFWFHMPVFFMITGILSKWGGILIHSSREEQLHICCHIYAGVL